MSDARCVIAVGKLYRGILITQTENAFVIASETGQSFEFISWKEACAFVDTWFAAYAAGEAMVYTA